MSQSGNRTQPLASTPDMAVAASDTVTTDDNRNDTKWTPPLFATVLCSRVRRPQLPGVPTRNCTTCPASAPYLPGGVAVPAPRFIVKCES